MKAYYFRTALFSMLTLSFVMSCTGGGRRVKKLDVRPMEEAKAIEAINEVLQKRDYEIERDIPLVLTNKVNIVSDIRIKGHRMAIEYLTKADIDATGQIPEPAPGSRLHVILAKTTPEDTKVTPENLYLLMIDERKFTYQYNPTSEHRADVTYLEVDSRLRRDINDFLSWYEKQVGR